MNVATSPDHLPETDLSDPDDEALDYYLTLRSELDPVLPIVAALVS